MYGKWCRSAYQFLQEIRENMNLGIIYFYFESFFGIHISLLGMESIGICARSSSMINEAIAYGVFSERMTSEITKNVKRMS